MHLAAAMIALLDYVDHDLISQKFARHKEVKLNLNTSSFDMFQLALAQTCTLVVSLKYEKFKHIHYIVRFGNDTYTAQLEETEYLIPKTLDSCRCLILNIAWSLSKSRPIRPLCYSALMA